MPLPPVALECVTDRDAADRVLQTVQQVKAQRSTTGPAHWTGGQRAHTLKTVYWGDSAHTP